GAPSAPAGGGRSKSSDRALSNASDPDRFRPWPGDGSDAAGPRRRIRALGVRRRIPGAGPAAGPRACDPRPAAGHGGQRGGREPDSLVAMRWLIDGYNVIRRDADLRAQEAESLEAGRTALLRLVARVARAGAARFTIVFDGAPASRPAPAGGQLAVAVSRPADKADDLLARLAPPPGGGPAGRRSGPA